MKIWLMLLPVIYCLVSLGFVSHSTERAICKGIDVTIKDSLENNFVNGNDVLVILKDNGYALLEQPLKLINLEAVENIIDQHPSIEKSECYLTANGTFKIDIFQRRPIVRVVGNKKNFYVDRMGEIMPTSRNYAAHVAVATGKISEQIARTDLFELAKFISNSTFWNSQIVQINVLYGPEFELIPRVGKHVIEFGDISNMEEKFRNIEALYQNDFNVNGWNRYRIINVKFKGQVVCTKK